MISEERHEEILELVKQHIEDVLNNQYYSPEETIFYLVALRETINIVLESINNG